MKQNPAHCQTVKGIMSQLNGVELKEKKGGKFKFHIYKTRTMNETSLEALDLGVRAYNSLKRAGYNTIGDLIAAISAGEDLNHIRNCGKTSIREIKERLFLYHYNSLSPESREDYLKEVVKLNKDESEEFRS